MTGVAVSVNSTAKVRQSPPEVGAPSLATVQSVVIQVRGMLDSLGLVLISQADGVVSEEMWNDFSEVCLRIDESFGRLASAGLIHQ